LELRLRKGRSVEVTVVDDATGVAEPGAHVRARIVKPTAEGELEGETLAFADADERGRARLDDVPFAEFAVSATTKPGDDRFANALVEVGRTNVELRLARPATVESRPEVAVKLKE